MRFSLQCGSFFVLASGLRTQIASTSWCDYRELKHAVVSEGWFGNVNVKYCDSSMVLSPSASKADAWADVNFWQPSSATFDHFDLIYVKNYLGDWKYSMPLGMLGRGLVPTPPLTDGGYDWAFRGTGVQLVKQVLNFEVEFVEALNKLPSVSAELWRGAWLPPETLSLIEANDEVKFSWVQSATTDRDHSFTFIHSKWQPSFCAPKCEQSGYAFPTHFHIQSSCAKNVTEWNEDEHEMILLPNLPFKVKGIKQVANDAVWYLTSSELVEWLNSTHVLPAWYVKRSHPQDPEWPRGPWPALASLAQQWWWNGAAFVVWYYKRFDTPGSEIPESMNISRQERRNLTEVMGSRFRLRPRETARGADWNKVNFFHEVELEDASPC